MRAYVHDCHLCGAEAGRLEIDGRNVRRTSFTSVLTQAAGDAVRGSLADPAALYAIDPELVPFYCPPCDAVYCGDHWRRTLPPGIRGTCPRGHERLLEE